jgi:hypothetical protein
MDNGSIFIGSKFTKFCGEFGIIMEQFSNYYPPGKWFGRIDKKNIDPNFEKDN